MTGTYVEVQAPERLVTLEAWGGDWPETTNTTIFSDLVGQTLLTCTVSYPNQPARDAAIETGMKHGWSLSYDRLDEYLRTAG